MERNLRKERIGVVVSNKMAKTIVARRDVQGGRYGAHHGDPPAEQDEALEISTNH